MVFGLNLYEAKNRLIEMSAKYKSDVQKLPRSFNHAFLEKTVRILKEGKKLNYEYKRHFLTGNRNGMECVHIPDPNAMVDSFEFSDWMLVFQIIKNRLILLETGTHAYLSFGEDE